MKYSLLPLLFIATTGVSFAVDAITLQEQSLPVASVHDIGGFVGQRMTVNKTGAIDGLDINLYVGMLEQHNTTKWFWIGEQPGKWLESAILTAKAQNDTELEARARAILARMIKAQEPDGYLGITADHVRTPEKPLRGMDPYEQYFTFHALLTAYEVWGDRAALDAATKLGDYYLNHIGPDKAQFWPSPVRPPANVNTILSSQFTWVPTGTPKVPKFYSQSDIAGHTAHYGLEGTLVVDPILRLYQIGGEKRFLDWAKWIVSMIDTWTGWNTFSKLDQVADGTLGIHELQPYVHSHTFHLNFLGFLRLYQITGDPTLLRKMEGAWSDIVKRQLYITGGVSAAEHYKPGYERPLEGHVVETCANMSWLQFNEALLELTGKPRYADTIEKLLVNHVFASQTIDGESNRYHTAPNGLKPEDYFHGPDCCTSSGQRQISMIPQWIYARSADTVIVNQFVPSTADFVMNGTRLTLTQETGYPEAETVKFSLKLTNAAKFTLKVRLPAWCATPALAVNDTPVSPLQSGSYAEINRIWHTGDTVELTLPMRVALVEHDHFPGPEAPRALVRGPVVYALDTVWWNETTTGVARPQNAGREAGLVPVKSPHIMPTGPRSLGPFYSLPVKLAGQPADAPAVNAIFVPFCNIGRWYCEGAEKPAQNSRAYSYAVWLYNADSTPFNTWATELANSKSFAKDTIDYVLPGDASEAAHQLKPNHSKTGLFQNRTYRAGPSFSYVMKVPTETASKLVVTYWGGETDERHFDILVNDTKVASQMLLQNKPGEFFDVVYDVPFNLISGQTDAGGQKVDKVTVRFVASGKSVAGGIFGLRIMNK